MPLIILYILNAQTDETKCNNNNTSMSAKYTEYLIIPFVCMTW